MINATHQRSGIEEKTLVRKFMKLFGRTESDAERIPYNLHAAKVTKGVVLETNPARKMRMRMTDARSERLVIFAQVLLCNQSDRPR